MIDELVLEQLLDELGQEIAVPPDGAERVVLELATVGRTTRRPSPRLGRALMVAAVIAVVAGIGLLMHGSTEPATRVANDRPAVVAPREQQRAPARHFGAVNGGLSLQAPQGSNGAAGAQDATGATGPAGASPGLPGTSPATPLGAGASGIPGNDGPQGPQGLIDAAKIVKTGTLDLEVPKDILRPTVNRVTAVAGLLRGYVADSKTDFETGVATGQITLRVPVGGFETAISRINQLPGVKVLGDSENGADVTAQYTNLQAQLNAATVERDSLLSLLAQANSLGDVLALHDRIAGANSQIDQLQGRINLLTDQANYSSIAITITERHVVKPAAVIAPAKPPTGLSKAWKDARQGFANSIEWLLARSGGALIVLLAALALVFGVRYLYPVVRRALL